MLPARILKMLVFNHYRSLICASDLVSSGKGVYTLCVQRCVDIDAMYVKESDTRGRRLKRKYEHRHEITCFMPYVNICEQQKHSLCICAILSAPLLFAVKTVYYLSKFSRLVNPALRLS